MNRVPSSLPRALDRAALNDDPFAFLERARALHGEAVVLRDGGPILSPSTRCPGTVALFGEALTKRVLGHDSDFVAPNSAAGSLHLMDKVVNLNRSLHGMTGAVHAAQRSAVAAALHEGLDRAAWAAMVNIVGAFADAWRASRQIWLVSTLRKLTSRLALSALFGEAPSPSELRSVLDRFFDLRRRLSAATGDIDKRDEIVAAGIRADELLRDTINAAREGRGNSGIMRSLLDRFDDDLAISHLNVMFMSIVEPVTVACAWLMMILSQQPTWRAASRSAYLTQPFAFGRRDALDCTILETLRLLSPNALMVRMAAHDVDIGVGSLPQGCEIILAPFLSHRDPRAFEHPTLFQPGRWLENRPSPYLYLPFGAGRHACPGRAFALRLIRTIAGESLVRLDPVLTCEQRVDWRVEITFRPRHDVRVSGHKLSSRDRCVKWTGPVSKMVEFGGRPT